MKKIVVVLMALGLTGCAYSQFKAGYLRQYSSFDCGALDSEMREASVEEKQVREKISASRPKGYQNHSVGSAEFTVLGPKPYHMDRMRNHARQKAILGLTISKGCRRDDLASNI